VSVNSEPETPLDEVPTGAGGGGGSERTTADAGTVADPQAADSGGGGGETVTDPGTVGDAEPTGVVLDEVVPARAPWIGEVAAGQRLRIVDLEGNQAVDFLAYDAHELDLRYDAAATISAQRNIFLTTGSVLRDGEGGPLATIVDDTCGRHDTIGGACSCESNTLRYGHHTKHQHACVENFVYELGQHGLGKRDVVSNINWFMNVPVEPDGALGIVDGLSAPG
jgi:urea carboxylase-associated protein 1